MGELEAELGVLGERAHQAEAQAAQMEEALKVRSGRCCLCGQEYLLASSLCLLPYACTVPGIPVSAQDNTR